MKHFLGIDIGTSSCKVLLMHINGGVTDAESLAYTYDQPKTGWAEQDPAIWVRAVAQCTKSLLSRQVDDMHIACVGLSGQMHGMTAVDGDGQVLRSCILWNDQRNGAECDELIALAGGDTALRSMTNNPMLVGFTAGKIRWFQKNEPELFAKTACILNPKDYIRYCLTGVMTTEVSDASGTGVFDVKNRRWSTELLQKVGINPSLLPPCTESTHISAHVNHQGSSVFGIPEFTPVVGGGGDAVIQTLGSGIYQAGTLQTTIGTAGIMTTIGNTALANTEGRIQVSCNVLPNSWHYMGVSLNAGGALAWWRNILQTQENVSLDYPTLTKWAEAVPIGSDGLVFLSYLMGERCPHPDPHARGAFVGLRSNHTTAHMCRAVFEGITYSIRNILSLMMDNIGVDHMRIITSGGGAKSAFWNQMQANVCGIKVAVVQNSEHGGALGASILGALATNDWTIDKIPSLFKEQQTWHPTHSAFTEYTPYFSVYQDLYTTLSAANNTLTHIQAQKEDTI